MGFWKENSEDFSIQRIFGFYYESVCCWAMMFWDGLRLAWPCFPQNFLISLCPWASFLLSLSLCLLGSEVFHIHLGELRSEAFFSRRLWRKQLQKTSLQKTKREKQLQASKQWLLLKGISSFSSSSFSRIGRHYHSKKRAKNITEDCS